MKYQIWLRAEAYIEEFIDVEADSLNEAIELAKEELPFYHDYEVTIFNNDFEAVDHYIINEEKIKLNNSCDCKCNCHDEDWGSR